MREKPHRQSQRRQAVDSLSAEEGFDDPVGGFRISTVHQQVVFGSRRIHKKDGRPFQRQNMNVRGLTREAQ